ncbi:hypothetical protein T11_2710 [Trichinella zimbabwensis]|uniref:Uncharacterized protein n=1 Tax=Trichinella zimbabwensis TaxID=268475 RepID=A0A0V1GLG8_9BILA|nr:hypothetical protein T11_2710 [Trichinella zimbabwensis]
MYAASTVENAIVFCTLVDHATGDGNAQPLFLPSALPYVKCATVQSFQHLSPGSNIVPLACLSSTLEDECTMCIESFINFTMSHLYLSEFMKTILVSKKSKSMADISNSCCTSNFCGCGLATALYPICTPSIFSVSLIWLQAWLSAFADIYQVAGQA